MSGRRVMVFEWSDRYVVGLEDVDAQHRQFLNTVNALYDAMVQGKGPTVLAETMAQLMAYTRAHFELEERYMRDCGYPDLARHLALHADFAQTLGVLEERIRTEDLQYCTVRLAAFLRDWVVGHILSEDRQLFEYRASMRPPKP